MRKRLFVALALLTLAGVAPQAAPAQFPPGGLPRIPRPGRPKPTPTRAPAESARPAPTIETPSATQPETRPEARSSNSSAPSSGGPYVRRPVATETPMLLPETMEVRTELQDYKWYPNVKFHVAHAGGTRLRYKAEYFMPTGALWYSETLEQKWDAPVFLIQSAYDSEKAGRATPTDGLFGIKITNLRDNSTAFQGKFRVVKYKPETASSAREADYYVDHDWALPIGYTNLEWQVDNGPSDYAEPGIQMWFKGGIKTEDLEARLFHNGQQIASTDEGGSINTTERRFPKNGGDNPALLWQLLEFRWPSKLLFIATEDARNYTAHANKRYLNQMPGEYTVKVFYQGNQVRETKFSIANGDFAPVGVTLPNGLKTYNRVILPVRVMGAADKWKPTTWKTEAFYANPPTGLTPPQ